MDALMPALVAGLLLGIGDRTSWLAAIKADQGRSAFAIVLSAAGAFGLGNAAAAQAGLWMPRMTPNAGALMLALALGFGGFGALAGARRPASFAGWPAFLGLFVLGFGEGMQFVTFALANRAADAGGIPALAAVGATLGTLAAIAPAAVLGEAAWLRLPLKPVRLATGALLLLAAAVLAVGALRLG